MTKRPPLVDLATHAYRWVSPPELAAYLGCDERTIRRMIAIGTLHAVRVGRGWHIPTDAARAAFPEPERRQSA